ncbi:Myosin-tail-1 multi-domain protein [Pyrenophora tritici-repentis]|nr:Myosin-tail-1 multi-domain protein [Pyrenophora tritici-repentis]
MVASMETDLDTNYEMKDLQHSLRNATLELNLERSKHSVEVVAKDEEIRKLRVAQCLLQDDNSDLHEQLEEEQARSDELESALDEALTQLDERHAEGETAQNTIRTQAREIANLRAELKAMENVTSDSNKILSDKLALSREISSLRPEVEHLRAQVEANTGLLTEKLALQRQLATLQVELENEKRTAARTLAKQGKKMEQDEELRNELDEVRKQLATEKRDRMKVEAGLTEAKQGAESIQVALNSRDQTIERLQAEVENVTKKQAGKATKREKAHDAAIEELRQELEQEKAARLQAEKASRDISARDAEIAQLRQELEQEKRERQKVEKTSKKGTQQTDDQVEAVRKELEEERRERKKQEKEFTKTLAELQGRNTILDDKLSAFREKLRTTKEKLKEKEAKLERADRAETAPPAKSSSTAAAKPAKNSRKRVAATVEPETMLGTPGDGFPAKKTKRGTSVSAVGDTSTFSLTPFLNRTGNVTAATPPKKASKKAAQPKVKALAPAASSKANAKPRKKKAAPALDMVTEEVSEVSHNTSKEDSENAPVSVPLKDNDGPSKKSSNGAPKVKPRKSLMSFATFVEEPAVEKKKKRKLGASAGKTLFDAEDAEDIPSLKPVGISKGLFAARALGKSVLGKQGQQRPISGGFNMMSEEAFTFSPLKKDRRGASILK